jgi:hypothetical protein
VIAAFGSNCNICVVNAVCRRRKSTSFLKYILLQKREREREAIELRPGLFDSTQLLIFSKRVEPVESRLLASILFGGNPNIESR